MKESRIIVIILTIMILLLIPFFFLLNSIGIDKELSISIISNLGCGAIVGLVTSLCQYFIAKRRIINSVYGLYFELYTTYYYVKNKEMFHHINAMGFYQKLIEVTPKINESLSDYHGFFKDNDSMYYKMNPSVNLKNNYKIKDIYKSMIKWFNEDTFNTNVEPLIKEIEQILNNIDKVRFNTDKDHLERMFNYVMN